MYQRLFEWVVNRINSVMEARGRDPRRDGKDTVIGVLDIYGFEVFPVNRWVARPPYPTLSPNLSPREQVSGVCPGWSLTPGSCPKPASAVPPVQWAKSLACFPSP